MPDKANFCPVCREPFDTPEALNKHKQQKHAMETESRNPADQRSKDAAARPESSGENRGGVKRSNHPN